MGLLATVAIWGALYLVSYLLRGNKPYEDMGGKGDLRSFAFPRAEEGSPVPIIWGRCRIRAPNVLWVGGYNTRGVLDEVNGETAVVAYEYSLYMQMLLGMVGAESSGEALNKPSFLKKMWVGDKLAWVGHEARWDHENQVSAREIFGGPGKGGGVDGILYYSTGNFNQGVTPTFQGKLEDDGYPEDSLPAYRGFATVSLRNFTIGEQPSLEPFNFEVMALTTIGNDTYGPGTETLYGIGDGDANPANVLLDALTNPWGRGGLDLDLFDLDSFYEAGLVLREEENGFSMVLAQSTDLRSVIDTILAQIDAYLYFDPVAEKYKIKLIREDYTVGTLRAFNESNVIRIASYKGTLWSETFNEVHVTYEDRTKSYATRDVQAQNGANIAVQGKTRVHTVSYPGCKTPELAAKLASRDLKALSLPLVQLSLEVNREAYDLRPGDCIRFSWSSLGITDMVLRVQRFDLGRLDDGIVVLETVQDRFAYDHTIYEQDDPQTVPSPQTPRLCTEQLITEVPRWMQSIAFYSGYVASPDVTSLFYMAIPRLGTSRYQGLLSTDGGASWAEDTAMNSFPVYATVATTYSRANDPYDTSVGLYIENLSDATILETAVDADITNNGKNLILVGNEIMAYKAFTSIGGGLYQLQNVYRGMLDTTPVAHAVGERIYFLYSPTQDVVSQRGMGRRALEPALLAHGKFRVQRGNTTRDPTSALYIDSTFTRGRPLLPYPPSDLKLDASKTPAALQEEGVDLTWRRRDRTVTNITLPNAADESVSGEGVVYDVYAQRSTDTEVSIVTGVNDDQYDDLPLAKAGVGAITVKVRSKRTAGSSVYTAWQDATMDVTAYHWRNLLRNPHFTISPAATYWTIAAGSLAATAGINGVQDTFEKFINGTTGTDTDFSQVVDVSGYHPSRMRVYLDFFGHNEGDADDTLRVDLSTLDAADSELQITTYGPTAESISLWGRHRLEITNCHANTKKLKVRVRQDVVGELDTVGSSYFAGPVLRLGQISDSLLTNGDFATGDLTGWTAVTNTFTVNSTAPYEGTYKAQCGDHSTAEMKQEVSVPAGFQFGTALLDIARATGSGSADTGEVILEVLDGGASVVATTTTGAEVITPTGTYQRRRLFVDIPENGVTLRVRLKGTRVEGTPLNSLFDDVHLFVHKYLQPSSETTYDLSTPTVQYLPQTKEDWEIYFPSVTVPNLGFWDGITKEGILGLEPELIEDETTLAFAGGTLHGPYNPDAPTSAEFVTTDCLEMLAGSEGFTTNNTQFANFRSTQSFTVVLAGVRVFGTASTDHALIGRRNTANTRGWRICLDNTGQAKVELRGTTATKTTSGGFDMADGALHMIALIYDANTNTLRCLTESDNTSVSTAGMGEISVAGAKFAIGKSHVGDSAPLRCQIGRVWMWNTALSIANVQSLWTHGGAPTSASIAMTRASLVPATIIHEAGPEGVVVGRFANTQYPHRMEGGSWGLVTHKAVTNLCKSAADMTTADWSTSGSPTQTLNDRAGPEGVKNALLLTGSSSVSKDMINVTVGAGTDVLVMFFARADTAHSMQVALTSSADVVKGTQDFAVTTLWQMFTHRFTSWDAATATCKLKFRPSNDGTSRSIHLCGPFFVHQAAWTPAWIPITKGSSGLTDNAYYTITATQPAQLNHEGELSITGRHVESSPGFSGGGDLVLAALVTSGGTNNNARYLQVSATDQGVLKHYDSTATAVDSTISATWNSDWTLNGRWCRAGLLDAASSFAGIIKDGSTSNYGRAATWTASSTALNRIHLGHNGSGVSVATALLRTIRVSSRERLL